MDKSNLAHPHYLMYKSRLKTFATWPPQLAQTKWELARAGFLYRNESDKVTCFACGVSLYGWKTEDDPWREHNKHSGNCPYLNIVCTFDGDGNRGDRIMDNILQDQSNEWFPNNVTMDEPDA